MGTDIRIHSVSPEIEELVSVAGHFSEELHRSDPAEWKRLKDLAWKILDDNVIKLSVGERFVLMDLFMRAGILITRSFKNDYVICASEDLKSKHFG
jgi:hypothetical protein